MFARIAAWSVAALLVVTPGPWRAHYEALAEADAGAVATAAVMSIVPAEIPAGLSPQVVADNPLFPDVEGTPKFAPFDAAEPDFATPMPAPLPPVPPAQPRLEPFGLATMPWFAGDIVTKWSGVEAQIRAEREILAHCRSDMDDCPPAAQKFLAVVAAGRAQTGRARIGVINRAVNLAIAATSDLKQWGVAERWSPPLETFASGRGDCEDYAIAKFVALIEAGVAPEDVRLVVVRDLAVNDGHAVAAARVDGDWVVLDSRWLALAEADKMRRLEPLFVIDQAGVKAYVRIPATVAAAAAAPAPTLALAK